MTTCIQANLFEYLQVELGVLLLQLAAGYIQRWWQVARLVFSVVDVGMMSVLTWRDICVLAGKGSWNAVQLWI